MHKARFKTVTGCNLSLWQSAVSEIIRENDDTKNVLKHPLMQGVIEHVIAADKREEISEPKNTPKINLDLIPEILEKKDLESLKYYSHLRYNIANAKFNKNQNLLEELEKQHDRLFGTDPIYKWVFKCEATYLEYLVKHLDQIKYRDWTTDGKNNINYSVIQMNQKGRPIRIGLVADWGTGTDDSVALLEEMVQNNVDVIIHLGDIYYSCTEKECNKIFDIIQKTIGDKGDILFYMIPGNHDYYSWGYEFFNLLDKVNKLNPPQLKQSASYFCLRVNQNLQILGVDTGRTDNNPFNQVDPLITGPDLLPNEKKWAQDKLKNFTGKTILLTHHQLFSFNSAINGKAHKHRYKNESLLSTFKEYFPKISAWFWGHEHNLIIFDPNLGLEKGRLIGCSGYEANETADSPYYNNHSEIKEYDPPKYRLDMEQGGIDQGYYNHGYAIIETSPDKTTVEYRQIPSWDEGEPRKTLPKEQKKIIFNESLD